MRKLGIIELLQRVGEENVSLQFLAQSMDGITMARNGDARVTFVTHAINATEVAVGTPRNVGIILWLPAPLVEQARTAWAAGGEIATPETRLPLRDGATATTPSGATLTVESGE